MYTVWFTYASLLMPVLASLQNAGRLVPLAHGYTCKSRQREQGC